ncbi:MAG: hypothetical protein MUF64_00925 [Polyangiaceae bacterium]|nr:hypothetical protein [Polyangiaceae bacterium]
MRFLFWPRVAWGLALLGLLGCGADYGGLSEASGAPGLPGSGGANGDGSGGSGGSVLPPEEELESNFLSPVATGKLVWVANPTSGRVAYLDAVTLGVKLVDAGNGPTHLAALPPKDGADRALVLNVLSRDATVLKAQGDTIETQTLKVPSGGNRWAIDRTGRYAIAWTDAGRLPSADPLDGFQDLTVLDLDQGISTALSVGYRPVAVSFTEDSGKALVVTQDGIGEITLGGAPQVSKNFPLTEDPLGATTRDVAITPDGSLALVRLEGASAITLVKLSDGSRSEVPLGGVVTDLDLSPDGKVAVAVVRELGKVVLLQVPAIAGDPGAQSALTLGSGDNVVGSAALAEESPVAFLYSNAASNPLLSTLDLGAPTPQLASVLLRAPVGAVLPTRDASGALVVHTKGPTDASTVYKSALSVVRVGDGLPPKIVGLEAPVAAVALGPSGSHALAAIGEDKQGPWQGVLVTLPTQQVRAIHLPSPPLAAGIVEEAKRGYIAQKHPEGRITFVDLETGEARTLTGFELAAQVVYGAKP